MLNVISAKPETLRNGAAQTIDEAMAERLLREGVYWGQRPLNEDRVLFLAERMELGTFLPNTQIAFCQFEGRLVLVNGQHRLSAVALARQSQSFRIEIYDCVSRAEVDAIYCRFDQPGGQRSLAQVSRALGLHDEGDGGLRPATAALLLRAVPLLMMELQRLAPNQRPRITRDLDAKREFAMAWKPQALDYQTALAEGLVTQTGRYRAGGVMAVALVTYKYQRELARVFWPESIRDSGLAADDPRHALHSAFLSARRNSEFDLGEMACYAWNAFFQRRPLKIAKVIGGPLRVAGSPFSGE